MKRTKATLGEIKYIEAWLKNPDKSGCPFPHEAIRLEHTQRAEVYRLPGVTSGDVKCEICYGYFPTLRERARGVLCGCPCSVYRKSYVVSVAKEILCLP